MKKTIWLMLVSLLAALLLFGCSGDASEEAAKDTSAKSEKSSKGGDTPPVGEAKTHAVRNADNQFVTVETDFGKMTLELYRDIAPAHADSFAARAKDGFYNGLTFHRIIDGFMIQGGCPQGTGMGGASYNLNAEFSDLPHLEGTLSMARGPSPHSASSQFFICLRPTPQLNGKYTVFGHLIKGYDTLHKLGKVAVQADARGEVSVPVEKVYSHKVYLSDIDGNPL